MKKVNIIYDFDGTLTQVALPRYLILERECNIQNGTSNKVFLEELNKIREQKNYETMQAFYELFFKILDDNNKKISEDDFCYGVDKIPYNKGLEKYFSKINKFAIDNEIELNHYILTSGVKGYVEKSKYAKFFKAVFGCTFETKDNSIMKIDYYLGTKDKIKKLELLQSNDETKAEKTIYIGDGLTDYYAMKYIHSNGGKTIFVHQNENDLDIYNEVNKEKIVDYCEIADYSEKTKLYNTICDAIVL